MSKFQNFFRKLSDWVFVGKRLPLIIAIFVIVAVTVTVGIVVSLNKTDSANATVYVTVTGLGDKDIENRRINIVDGEAVMDVVSLKYESIYNDFGQPLVRYNEFYSFMGVKKTAEKSFHIQIDGKFDSNLETAYLYDGQTLTISYY